MDLQRRYPLLIKVAPYLAVAAILIAFMQLCLTGMVRRSATYDEPVYLVAGYTYWLTGDYRLKRDAPPLVPLLSGGTIRLLESVGMPVSLPLDSPHWQHSLTDPSQHEYDFANDFFETNHQRSFLLLQAARLPIVAIGVILGIVLFRFGQRLFGMVGGLLALLMAAFDPNIIAHATIVSADLPLAACFLATHFYYYRLLCEDNYRALPWVAAWFALTISVKFTGLLIAPSLGLVTAIWFLLPGDGSSIARSTEHAVARRQLLKKASLTALCSLLAAWLLLSILYQRWDAVAAYQQGVKAIYQNIRPGYEYYLLGEFRAQTWPHYYLVAMLLKTPETTLVLMLLALWPWRLADPAARYPWRKVLLLLLPVLLVHAVSALDRTNLGLRRVLLTYPFLYLLIGRLGEAWRMPAAVWRGLNYQPLATATLVLAVFLHLAIAWRTHPYQLAYFNFVSGGPSAAPDYLDDSNIDWGQDLPSLYDYLAAENIKSVRYRANAVEPAERYGIHAVLMSREEALSPQPEVYVLGVHQLIRMRHEAQRSGDQRFDWLSRYEPTQRIGFSMYVYDFHRGQPQSRPHRP